MQSFIGLALMVPEITKGPLKTPLVPLNGKNAWPEQVKARDLEIPLI